MLVRRITFKRCDLRIIATILREAILEIGNISAKNVAFDCDLYCGRSLTLEFKLDAETDDETDDPGAKIRSLYLWDGYMYIQGHREQRFTIYKGQLDKIRGYVLAGVNAKYYKRSKHNQNTERYDNEADFQDADGMGNLS